MHHNEPLITNNEPLISVMNNTKPLNITSPESWRSRSTCVPMHTYISDILIVIVAALHTVIHSRNDLITDSTNHYLFLIGHVTHWYEESRTYVFACLHTGAVLGSRSFIFLASTTCAIITFILSSVLLSCFVIMSSEMSTWVMWCSTHSSNTHIASILIGLAVLW